MNDVVNELDQWSSEGEQIALATVVGMAGSAPRMPGARLAMTRGGRMAGSVSGGCVENDVYERALQVLDSGTPALVNYGIADELGFEVGLSCGGSIDVLIEPYTPDEAWNAVRQAIGGGTPAALAIGLAPAALLGRRLAIVGDDATAGSIDPQLDDRIANEARRLVLEGGATTLTLPHEGEEATVFVDTFPPPLRLFIVGATHTAIPLSRLAASLGFRVTVIDARSMFAERERFPDADEVIRGWPDDALTDAGLDAYSYVVILSHDPKFDLPTLTLALRSDARYIGAIGSRATHETRKESLRAQGFGDDDLARIRAPIGLDLGGRTPEETALAIMAEIVAVRHDRDGAALANKKAAVHGGG